MVEAVVCRSSALSVGEKRYSIAQRDHDWIGWWGAQMGSVEGGSQVMREKQCCKQIEEEVRVGGAGIVEAQVFAGSVLRAEVRTEPPSVLVDWTNRETQTRAQGACWQWPERGRVG